LNNQKSFLSLFIMGGNLGLHLSVRTSQTIVCATPSTLLDGFCSYSHTVTNLAWRWQQQLDFGMLEVLHELWDFVIFFTT